MITRKNLLQHLNPIDGFLRDDEALLLFDLARITKGRQDIVEIGSWKGKSTICLAAGSLQGDKSVVTAIDPHTGSPEHKRKFKKVDTFSEFKKNLANAKVDAMVKPLRFTSHLASRKFNKPIKLLFIDGNHSYKSAKQDFFDWSPKVIDGGIIAFHDTISWPGPRRIVHEAFYNGKNFKNIRLLGSITYAQKTSKLTLNDQIKNKYALAIRQLRNLFANTPLPQSIRNQAKIILRAIQW